MDIEIQAYLRVAASRTRETEQIGPFLATFTPASANPYLNYAIPNHGAMPTNADIAALVAAFVQHERKPRLEYVSGLAPEVEPALVANGFTVEARTPLMVCPPDAVHEFPPPDGIELLTPSTDDEILGMIAAQNEAYGEGPPSPDQVPRRREALASGGFAIMARDIAAGEIVGGGICDVPAQGATELAGIGVRVAFRRRGIAQAMAARLTHDALAAGTTTVFLMAEGEPEARIYRRVGFVDIGEVLFISHP